MLVLVAFHFDNPPPDRLACQTDVVEVSLEGSYEDVMSKIFRRQEDLSHFLGEDWAVHYPFQVLWLSHDHHGKLPDIEEGAPPLQTLLRKKNWRQVLGMMEQRGSRDVIQVEVEGITERAGMSGLEIETDAMVEWRAEVNRARKSRIGNTLMGTMAEDSACLADK